MAKVRQILYTDLSKIKKLITLVCVDEILSYRRMFSLSVPMTFIQNFFPLNLRFLPETYVVYDEKLKGVIAVQPTPGNNKKWNITRLFLDKNSHEDGKQLVEFVTSKLAATGVTTFIATVDDTNDELLDLFVKGCGFRVCSYEALWHVSNINFINNVDFSNFKIFKNSDASKVCDFYNENIIPYFRYSLAKEKFEFYDKFAQGLYGKTEFKYILEDNKLDTMIAYILIKTWDNHNYFVDIIVSMGYTEKYPDILTFAVKEIMKRNKKFNLYLKTRKYMSNAYQIETFLKQYKFELLQNQMVLVKDLYKKIRDNELNAHPAIIFSGIKSFN